MFGRNKTFIFLKKRIRNLLTLKNCDSFDGIRLQDIVKKIEIDKNVFDHSSIIFVVFKMNQFDSVDFNDKSFGLIRA